MSFGLGAIAGGSFYDAQQAQQKENNDLSLRSASLGLQSRGLDIQQQTLTQHELDRQDALKSARRKEVEADYKDGIIKTIDQIKEKNPDLAAGLFDGQTPVSQMFLKTLNTLDQRYQAAGGQSSVIDNAKLYWTGRPDSQEAAKLAAGKKVGEAAAILNVQPDQMTQPQRQKLAGVEQQPPYTEVAKGIRDLQTIKDAYGENSEQYRMMHEGLGQDPTKNTEVLSYQKEHTQNAMPVATATAAYDRLISAPETAKGDITRIYALMKILNPGVQLRGNAAEDAKEISGVSEQISNWFTQAVAGTGLDTGVRAQIADAGKKGLASSLQSYIPIENQAIVTAKQRGLPWKNVVIDFLGENRKLVLPEPSPEAVKLLEEKGKTEPALLDAFSQKYGTRALFLALGVK